VNHQRVTVKEAARLLNTTDHAVRQRLYRGTLRSEKDVEGRVFVLITDDLTEVHDESHRESHSDSRPSEHHDGYAEGLIEELREQNRFLRDQLDKEREANRENRRLLAAALERIPELEGPRDTPSRVSPESPDDPEAPAEGMAGEKTPPEPQKPSQRRSWLYRFFFGL
jgi:hypothetical protein